MQEHYDVIVVGSGYGGSIAACRLSRAGRRVALFERGRELHPGEFPTSMAEAARHMQTDLPTGGVGDPRSLYWLHVGDNMSVFSGCGLGGTSLVNANVSLPPDPRVFEDERWPQALRRDVQGMAAGFDRARSMLTPAVYPDSYPPLAKMRTLEIEGGEQWHPTPINVTFRAGPNAAGVHQEACTGCGDCVTGCNVGAKNTLLMNYLPDAVAHGTSVFCETEVRWVEPAAASPASGAAASPRWVVHVQPLGAGRDRFDAPPLPVTADVVILAAGTLGSTRVLFRSREKGLALSARLGRRFTGNGDVLGFAWRPHPPVNAVGAGDRAPDSDKPAGPCITSFVDRRGGVALEDGIIIEDAVVPGAIADLLPAELGPQLLGAALRHPLHARGPLRILLRMVSGGRRVLGEHVQTLLVMGNDDAEGVLEPGSDGVRLRWPGVGASAYYERATRQVAETASVGGGRFMHDPVSARLLHRDLITVHPLGGCVMAEDADGGVVDHLGRVFAGPAGAAVHEGLFVWDGSIVPRPLGVNPLLTISALTERGAYALAAENGWTIDEATATPPTADRDAPVADAVGTTGAGSGDPAVASPSAIASRPGLRFTERMAGFWSPTDTGPAADYDAASRAGEQAGSTLSFDLTLSTDDLRAEVSDLARPMQATGTVLAPDLSPEPLVVTDGVFQLLVADDPDPAVRHMWYRLPLTAVDGRHLHFSGFKVVAPGDVADVWPSTTTLFVTLRRDGPDGPVLGRGVLHIKPEDFVTQLRTMSVTGPVGTVERLTLEARFGRAFAGKLFEEYGSVVHRPTGFNRRAAPRRRRRLDLPPRQESEYRTDDGVALRLTRYRGGNRGPVVLSHGMGANPLTYLLDTIEPNLTEYLVAQGFDVWLQEWRGSTLLPTARRQFDADDVAWRDHAAAQAAVRAGTGRADIHVVSHCVGSITWMMAILAGTAEPASLLCSSVSMHPIGPSLTKVKAGLRLAQVMKDSGVRMLTTDSFADEPKGARLLDVALRAYPIPRAERCDQPVCRRLAFIYGNAVHHTNVNDATHTTMHELFGPTDMRMMAHLSRMARVEMIVSADGSDDYTPHLERVRCPMTFLSGRHNRVWVTESVDRTVDLLQRELDPGLFERVVFEDYGHQDVMIGQDAARDTFPSVLAHLDRANA
jgi:cholesterol oxidase